MNIIKYYNSIKKKLLYPKKDYITWEEICKDNPKHIYVVGYGSLMCEDTLKSDTNIMGPAETTGFKRVFNSPHGESNFVYSSLRNLNSLPYKDIISLKQPFLNPIQCAALNVVKTGNIKDKVNGLLLKINRESFKDYAIREASYKLYPIKVRTFNGCCGETTNGIIPNNAPVYILSNDTTSDDSIEPYEAYQKSCDNGARKQGRYFYKQYCNTTFTNEDIKKLYT